MRKILLILALFAFAAGLGKGLYHLKGGFTARRIHSLPLSCNEDFDEESKSALLQTFHYIGRGRQCFAFESSDGKYVLKFPRTDIYKIPFWARVLPVHSYREHLICDRAEREQFILDSFRIAFAELKDQTGILAIHLGQSESKQKLTVLDAFGCKHHLPLGKTSFVLQNKHPILIPAFQKALSQGDRKEAKRILDALIEAIRERASLGILNRDRSFLRNYGFDGQKAYQIDVGSFFRNESLDRKVSFEKSIRDSIDPIQEWLAKTDPEMLLFLNEKLTALIDEPSSR